MSAPQPTVLNGPTTSDNNVPFKDAQAIQDTTQKNVHQREGEGNVPPQTHPNYVTSPPPPRPPLTRLDSRSSINPIRPGFPAPGQPSGPLQRAPIRPGQPQFIQRPPGPPRPPFIPNQPQNQAQNQPQFQNPAQFQSQSQFQSQPYQNQPQTQNPQLRPVLNPNIRPGTPFPRPPPPRQIFQQRSFPSPGSRPVFEPELQRRQTLDQDYDPNEEERRRSVTSLDGRKSSTGSMENLEEPVSRPESRAGIRMNKIVEGKSTSEVKVEPQITVEENSKTENPAQKTVEFKLPELAKPEAKSEIHSDHAKTPREKNLEPKSLDLKKVTPSRADGDNDSGVDESTQGNSSNGDQSSPRKSSSKIATRTTTPTKNRSLSRGSLGSKSPSLKSPDSTASTPGAVEKKKIPMNKVQVGSAPSPNLKVIKSKIGSLQNANHKPGGGNVKIENVKLEFNAAPRIQAKNEKYTPKGGDKKIQQQKLQWNASSKIGSLENTTHKPKGGEKKIETVKLDFKEKAKSKVGSKDNMKYVPKRGDVKIENRKIEIKAQSKIGSMDNVKHRPGGGDKKIFDDKDYLRQKSTVSNVSENHSLSGSQHSLPSQPDVGAGPVADENLNQER